MTDPAREFDGYFRHEELTSIANTLQKPGFCPVAFIKSQPFELYTALAVTIVKFQGNAPLGPIHHIVRNPGCATSLPILRPTLWQKQLAIQEAVKIACGIA